MKRIDEVKSMLHDITTMMYSTMKNGSIEISKEKGRPMSVRKARPTRHTIKWKAKNR